MVITSLLPLAASPLSESDISAASGVGRTAGFRIAGFNERIISTEIAAGAAEDRVSAYGTWSRCFKACSLHVRARTKLTLVGHCKFEPAPLRGNSPSAIIASAFRNPVVQTRGYALVSSR
jgi:hypothetical protein